MTLSLPEYPEALVLKRPLAQVITMRSREPTASLIGFDPKGRVV